MSLDQLRAVVTIAEEGTVVRAARRLHISQPPLTRKVRALEDELGVDLFERGARGMRPTAAGAVFLSSARSILAEVDGVGARVRGVARAEPPDQGPMAPTLTSETRDPARRGRPA